jgi:hypothetical protein
LLELDGDIITVYGINPRMTSGHGIIGKVGMHPTSGQLVEEQGGEVEDGRQEGIGEGQGGTERGRGGTGRDGEGQGRDRRDRGGNGDGRGKGRDREMGKDKETRIEGAER